MRRRVQAPARRRARSTEWTIPRPPSCANAMRFVTCPRLSLWSQQNPATSVSNVLAVLLRPSARTADGWSEPPALYAAVADLPVTSERAHQHEKSHVIRSMALLGGGLSSYVELRMYALPNRGAKRRSMGSLGRTFLLTSASAIWYKTRSWQTVLPDRDDVRERCPAPSLEAALLRSWDTLVLLVARDTPTSSKARVLRSGQHDRRGPWGRIDRANLTWHLAERRRYP